MNANASQHQWVGKYLYRQHRVFIRAHDRKVGALFLINKPNLILLRYFKQANLPKLSILIFNRGRFYKVRK